MILKDYKEFIEGIFIGERKNRFVGLCKINGISKEIYVPSSSRLEPFITLEGREVLLTKTKGIKCKYQYKLFACKNSWDNNYSIIDFVALNKILGELLKDEFKTLKQEFILNGSYKTDFYDNEMRTGIEIKAILLDKTCLYPTHSTIRKLKQLKIIESLLNDGFHFIYCFVANKKPVNIELGENEKEFNQAFLHAIYKGMQIRKYYISLNSEKSIIIELCN